MPLTELGLPIVTRSIVDELRRDINTAVRKESNAFYLKQKYYHSLKEENPELYKVCEQLHEQGQHNVSEGFLMCYALLHRTAEVSKTLEDKA